MKKVKSVEEYIEVNSHWQEELQLLRSIILKTEAIETLKWSAPVYTVNGKNVIGLGAFKQHFGIWFFNGVFLKDKHQLLSNAQEGKTKALRQMRFESRNEINETIVLDYVKEAIENQKAGKELKPERKASKAVEIPELLANALQSNAELSSAFKNLSPYKQREYCEHILTAKREATKLSRLEKITPMLLQGIGLNDKYRNC
ncbi:YdeI/OmpD-associated family protein [Winogradskyella immobilis]|uniref:YdeI/OmpD-associated family protein n=1 Tax=Winogradskyella immobilis TaxID=2816852 RepID=A0ABS8EPB5_9FLAO|nr:YdeI/OmpD-associated family protein [Winogradskyella immobilis]MCC1485056.1 YdeI/OmpD-associated family protein [Winogradskyella immobilis]MCG0017148.1 YdeI/OmpD-associated family protein [Winogradskyella immobilis]